MTIIYTTQSARSESVTLLHMNFLPHYCLRASVFCAQVPETVDRVLRKAAAEYGNKTAQTLLVDFIQTEVRSKIVV